MHSCHPLPGVQVDLPVLAPNDILDVQKFGVKNNMDYIAASFVQSAEDVRYAAAAAAVIGVVVVVVVSGRLLPPALLLLLLL